MRFVRLAAGLCVAIAGAALAASCGPKSHGNEHREGSATPAPAPPTPDTTPIAALRTPAGLVLKIDSPTPSPAAAPARTPVSEK
jgi:hypothetical protein